MIRALIVAAVGGALLSVGCFSAMHALGPVSLDLPHFVLGTDTDTGPQATRAIPWSGGDALRISVPCRVIYTQGPAASISVEGPESYVGQVRMSGSEISGPEGNVTNWGRRNVVLRITAPAVKAIAITTAAAVRLNSLALDDLKLSIDGLADVKANGQVRHVALDVDGAASVNLADVTMKEADISISGAGHVKAGPTVRASVTIDGVGSVKLTHRPAVLNQNISGLGSVSVPHGEETPVPDSGNDEDQKGLNL